MSNTIELKTFIQAIFNELDTPLFDRLPYYEIVALESQQDICVKLLQFAQSLKQNQQKENKNNQNQQNKNNEGHEFIMTPPMMAKPNPFSLEVCVEDFLRKKVPSLFENELFLRKLKQDDLYGLLLGKVQSGKTSAQIAVAMYNVLVNRRSTVWVLRNLTGDYLQGSCSILSMIGEKSDKDGWLKFLDTTQCKVTEFVKYAYVGDHTKKGVTQELKDALTTDSPRIIICLANHTQLGNLSKLIRTLQNDGKDVCYDLVIDEVDAIFENEESKNPSKRQGEYASLRDKAQTVLGVTATGFAPLFGDRQMRSDNVFTLAAPDKSYTGIEHCMFSDLKLPINVSLRKNKEYCSIFDQDTEMAPFFREMDAREPYMLVDSRTQAVFRHPVYVLLNNSRYVDHHNEVVKYFAGAPRLEKNWVAISYDGAGITMYHKSFTRTDIQIRSKASGKIVSAEPDNIETHFPLLSFKNLQIGDVLEWLRNDDPEVNVYTHIIVVSGILAGRGINFVSNNYSKRINTWHISDLYLKLSKNTDCSEAQQCQRACGIFNDNLVPTVYTTVDVKTSVLSSVSNQTKLVKEVETRGEDHVINVVCNVEFDKKEVPTRALTNKFECRQRVTNQPVMEFDIKIRIPNQVPESIVKKNNIRRNRANPAPRVEYEEKKQEEDDSRRKIDILRSYLTVGVIYTREAILDLINMAGYYNPKGIFRNFTNNTGYGSRLFETIDEDSFRYIG